MEKCALCGRSRECKLILRDTFTDLDRLQGRELCEDCAKLFDNEWLKTGFYWTKKEKRKMKQNEFFGVLHNLEFPCLISFSESRKKHRLFRSKWSYKVGEVYISTDTGEVRLDLRKDLELLDYLQGFYQKHKCSKSWLLEGLPVNFIRKIGLEKYLEFERKTKKLRKTQKYKLFIDFLNK